MQKNILTGAVVIGIIAIIAIAYQSMVVIPQNKIDLEAREARLDREAAAREKRNNALMYDACMSDAFSAYNNRWESTCEDLGRKENCMLPNGTASSYEVDRKDAEDRCLTLYK